MKNTCMKKMVKIKNKSKVLKHHAKCKKVQKMKQVKKLLMAYKIKIKLTKNPQLSNKVRNLLNYDY